MKQADWMEQNVWGRWGSDDEVGALNELSASDVIKAAGLIKRGKLYDLETVRFKGMPVWPGHGGFEMLCYASPHGRKNMAPSLYRPGYAWFAPGGWLHKDHNHYHAATNTEIMISPLHVGTHIDSLCHATVGEDAHWYNGFNEKDDWSDFGPLKADATTIPPMFMRGVLLDIPAAKGLAHLPPNYGISVEDIELCVHKFGVSILKNDAVLLRTGELWPEADRCPNTGLTVESARYLVEEKGAVLLGNDQIAFECVPEDSHHPNPVHHYLLIQQGVHIMELLQLEGLARDKVHEFCFIAAPNKVMGGTGMYLRPLAVI